jgi:hypothetical protein
MCIYIRKDVKILGYFSKPKGAREQKRSRKLPNWVQKQLGCCFECGDYIAEGDVCRYHVISMLSKRVITLFSLLTLS